MINIFHHYNMGQPVGTPARLENKNNKKEIN